MNQLKNQFTELSKYGKEVPFRVPENYFDDFSARLQTRLETEKTANPETENRIIKFLKPALGLAASFALIFMLVYWPVKWITPEKTAGTQDMENGLSDLEFRSILEGIDMNTFYALFEEEPAPNNEISNDEMLQYLSASISDYDIFLNDNN